MMMLIHGSYYCYVEYRESMLLVLMIGGCLYLHDYDDDDCDDCCRSLRRTNVVL